MLSNTSLPAQKLDPRVLKEILVVAKCATRSGYCIGQLEAQFVLSESRQPKARCWDCTRNVQLNRRPTPTEVSNWVLREPSPKKG